MLSASHAVILSLLAQKAVLKIVTHKVL